MGMERMEGLVTVEQKLMTLQDKPGMREAQV